MDARPQPDLKRTPRVSAASNMPSRILPHSEEAEQGVLGCILLQPDECMGTYVDKAGGREVFYDLRHQTIINALVDLYDARKPIDTISLVNALRDSKELDAVGGVAYISSLNDVVPSAANLSYYLEIVFDKWMLRRAIQVGTTMASEAYDFEGQVSEFIDQSERDILKIRESNGDKADVPVKDLVNKAIDSIEADFQRQGKCSGIETGFADFDKVTSGLQNGEMTVIAARPSVGKTAYSMNIVEHVVLDLKLPTGVFSLEMTGESLIKRMMCSRARVNLRNIRDGVFTQADFPKMTVAAGDIQRAPLYIDDRSGLSIMQVRAKARRWHRQYGIKLLVIDYLQLMNDIGSRRKYENRQQEITAISGGVKGIAKELNIPVIVLCQLNRELEKDKNRKPRMSDLRESGAIEQDADVIGMLYRPKTDEDEDGGANFAESVPVNLLIAKARNGPAGEDVPLTFLKAYTRFESAARFEPSDIPEGYRQSPD